MAGGYGYLHRGVVHAHDATTGGYTVRIPTLAPGRIMGPFPSMAVGVTLTAGTRVALASIGASRDDLVIVGPLPGRVLGIGDVTGLSAALDAKADDADVTALDARLDSAESELVVLDGRSDSAEGRLTSAEGRLTTQETTTSVNSDRIYALELNPFRADRDLYTDVLSTFNREDVVNSITLVNGTIYVVRLYARPAMSLSAIRMVTAVAGVAGTGNIALYAGSTVTSLAQVRSGTINLTTLGRVTHNLSSAYNAAAGTHLAVALLPLSYTTAPQVGGKTGIVHSALLNPGSTLHTSLTKSGQVSLPASIDISDGTWTTTVTSKMWVAMG